MSPRRKLRALLAEPTLVVAPGAYDAITARLIADAAFDCIYMTGAGVAATLGYPDFGLLTMTEVADHAARMADAVDLPIVADADTGYGNELNTYRTVRAFERAGVAAVQLEDQTYPKRCGHLDGKEVVPIDDFVAKIRSALDARTDPDLLIVARTDARAVIGFAEAIDRANAAAEAGADLIFVEAPQSLAEVAEVPARVRGPCLLNVVEGGKTPPLPLAEAERLGYRLAIIPALLTRSVVDACDAVLDGLRRSGELPIRAAIDVRTSFSRFGADEWQPRMTKYRRERIGAASD